MESDLKSGRFTTDWRGLSGDLWAAEIFHKLPIKSLGRCRCVCNGWNYLISSRHCIATRKSRYSYTAMPTTYPLLFFKMEPFSSIFFKRPSLSISNHPHLAQPIKILSLPFQFPISNLDLELVDVIHGVLCFSYSISSSFDSVLLWNPAICKYVAIPKKESDKEKALESRSNDIVVNYLNPMSVSRFELSGIGFGYSNLKNEFKVIRVWIPFSTSSSITIRHEVFSSRRGLWSDWKETVFKTKDSTGCRFGFITPTGHFYDGIVHWILSMSDQSHSLSMLMFDCESEELITSELPESFSLVKGRSAQLIRYSGRISILLSVSGKIELWVKERQTTWNILFKGKDDDFHYDDKMRRYFLTRENQPLNGYVYEESMFLMDQPRGVVKSYTKGETFDVITMDKTPTNWIKLSTHAATRGARHPAGLGGVFTDDHGRFVRAFACKGKKVKSALDEQVRCLSEGLQLAARMRIHYLLVEMDVLLLYQALTTSKYKTEERIDDLIDYCRVLLRHKNWRVGICYVPAELNSIANWFAKTGKSHDSEIPVLFDDAPYEVEQLLANQLTTKRKRRMSTRKSDFVTQ